VAEGVALEEDDEETDKELLDSVLLVELVVDNIEVESEVEVESELVLDGKMELELELAEQQTGATALVLI
jgi:hypothetical protein